MAVVECQKAVAIIALTVMLLLCGIAFFSWSAAMSFIDTTSVITAGIFVGLGIIQAGYTVLWWRLSAAEKKDAKVPPKAPVELKIMEATTQDNLMASPLLAPNGKGTPCSLRSDASSIPLGPRPFDVSGSIPYVDATSQSESSVA